MPDTAEPPDKIREITIMLDTYEDIFSDFDPRPFAQRALSEDFLKEVSRRYLEDRRGRFEVHFTMPSSDRDLREEALIKKRLREHFSFMAGREDETVRKIKGRGALYISLGILVLLAEAYLFFVFKEESLLYHLLSILLVPAGWYGMFTGIGKLLDEPYDAAEKKKIYEKFERANYIFISDDRE
jgi:hypothetical protein